MVTQNPAKEWRRLLNIWLRSLWTEIDVMVTGNLLSATSGTSSATSGQDSSGQYSSGSERSFGTASEINLTGAEISQEDEGKVLTDEARKP